MFTAQHRKVLILALSGTTALVLLILTIVKQATIEVENFAAESSAAAYLDILAETQHFYSQEIVAYAARNGIAVRRDFANHPNSIPFPATFMHGLTEALSDQPDSRHFRVYSRWPLHQRENSGPQDRFEEEALAFFERRAGAQTFSRVEQAGGKRLLRYAVALRMGESCIGCHNTHADSPKRDWMLGDLRGVQAVSQPIEFFSALSVAQDKTWLYIFTAMSVSLVLAIIVTVVLLAWRHIDLKNAHARIEILVWQDTVCDLTNRRGLIAAIEAELNAPDPKPFGVFIMDLVDFKTVNDVHGHAGGDEVLKIIGKRLEQLPYPDITVARTGGDEFALLRRGTIASYEIEDLARSIVSVAGERISLGGRRVQTGTSVGIALAPEHGRSARELLENADMAMYRAKATSGCDWCYFTSDLRESALHADSLAEEIRDGLNHDQFVVYYQPQFRIGDGRMFGLEALIRWSHPERGLLYPGDFLPVAQDRGLIVDLSETMVQQLIKDVRRWWNLGYRVPRISINIHEAQISDTNHIHWLDRSFQEAGIEPEDLTFEITECCVLGRGREEVPALLRRWRDRGYGVSLDDFGTGFASLSHLKTLPVSEVKIDRSFVQDVIKDRADQVIIEGLIKLADETGIVLIAEGVETTEQAQRLRKMGCAYAQGYVFAHPMTSIRADVLMKDNCLHTERQRPVTAA